MLINKSKVANVTSRTLIVLLSAFIAIGQSQVAAYGGHEF